MIKSAEKQRPYPLGHGGRHFAIVQSDKLDKLAWKYTQNGMSIFFMLSNVLLFIFLSDCVVKGLVTPANGYVPEGKRTKVCKIWLSGDKIYLLCRSKFSRSVCGAWKLSNDRTSTGHVTGKTHDNRMCTG